MQRLLLDVSIAAVAVGLAGNVTAETLAEIGARLGAESQAAYAASPFSELSKDYFSRFYRDPEVVAGASDVEITSTWKIVVPGAAPSLARRMGAHLSEFLERMNLTCSVTDVPAAPGIHLELDNAGNADDESFVIQAERDRIVIRSASAAGLRDGVVKLAETIGLRRAPILPIGEHGFTPRLRVRLGSTPWMGTERDLVFMGYNAKFVSAGDLYSSSTSEAIPELAARRAPGALEGLVKGVEEAENYGLHTFCFTDIRRKFPKDDPIFQRDPSLRGALTWKADGEYVLCTEHPAMKQFLEESVAGIFRAAPKLDGLVIIIGGEGFYHCFMRAYGAEKGHTTCSRCEPLGAERVVANLCNRMARAARQYNPRAEIVAWPYSAEHVWSADKAQRAFIELLEPGCAIFTEMEKDEYVSKPNGVRKHLWDYSIDLIGPGERARQQIDACRKAGISIYMKSEPELGFEAPRLPHIPCMDRWLDRADALAACGADGAWVFPAFRPNYGTSAAESYKLVWWKPHAGKDEILDRFAKRIAGETAGPHLRNAWRLVSEAIPLVPEIPSYYKGPYYLGPAHPMCADRDATLPDVFYGKYLFMAEMTDAEGLKSLPTFVTSPTGNVPVFTEYYAQLRDVLEKAVQEVELARPGVNQRHQPMFNAEASAITWFYRTARTEANFYASCMLRDKLTDMAAKPQLTEAERTAAREALDAWRAVLADELENARAAIPLVEADMRLDFYYGGDHTFPHAVDMLRAKIELSERELAAYVPALAATLGAGVKD